MFHIISLKLNILPLISLKQFLLNLRSVDLRGAHKGGSKASLLETRVNTSADFNTYPIRIFHMYTMWSLIRKKLIQQATLAQS